MQLASLAAVAGFFAGGLLATHALLPLVLGAASCWAVPGGAPLDAWPPGVHSLPMNLGLMAMCMCRQGAVLR